MLLPVCYDAIVYVYLVYVHAIVYVYLVYVHAIVTMYNI